MYKFIFNVGMMNWKIIAENMENTKKRIKWTMFIWTNKKLYEKLCGFNTNLSCTLEVPSRSTTVATIVGSAESSPCMNERPIRIICNENKNRLELDRAFAQLSTHFSISGAQWTKSWSQNLYDGFLMSSMKVMSKPHGCGRFTIKRSNKTLVICS